MKIAFVSGNREKLPDACVPLGLLYVMASTDARHQRSLLDLCFEHDPQGALRAWLADTEHDLIALGMRNIQNNDYSGIKDNLDYYAGLISVAREVSDAPIVLGGGGFSVMPRELMEHLKPDFGVSGEGERAFSQLVDALDSPEPERSDALGSIGSLLQTSPSGVLVNPAPADFLVMDELPVPDRSYVDPRYYQRHGIESIQTKRGCALRCEYCSYPLIEGRIGRVRDPEAVVDEMESLLISQPDTRHIFLVDSVFNLPRTHAKNVCRSLIRRDWSLPWTCYANPLGFDAEFAALARQAGCAGMEVGSDSGCDEVLDRLRKGFKTTDITRLHEICVDQGLPDCHTFILGTRGESLEDVKRSLDFAAELDPFAAIMMIWVDDHEALDPALRLERMRLREGIEGILTERAPEHPHWIVPPMRINFDPRQFRGLRRAGFDGPLWQHLRPRAAVPS
jgi:radical SAM superfamily enzyme YgiQ (UPF0313 family)